MTTKAKTVLLCPEDNKPCSCTKTWRGGGFCPREIRIDTDHFYTAIKSLERDVGRAIDKTPTGPLRDILTEINIHLGCAQMALDKLKS